MATLNISMPDQMREYIESRVKMGEYQSASDYLRDLIRHDKEEIDILLTEGLNSGESESFNIDRIRQRAKGKLKKIRDK